MSSDSACLPQDWAACRDPARKRPKTFVEAVDTQAVGQVALRSSLPDTIRRCLSLRYGTPDLDLDADHILSRVPYRSMLENLFSGARAEQPDLPIVSKSWEESFMRQPATSERPCGMGDQCECM